jgi:hypothetical protein
MRKLLLSALALCVLAASAMAQGASTGRLVGTVSSPDGLIAGATVTVTDNATGRERTVTTNEEGAFSVPQLEASTYTVVVSAAGFKGFTANEVKIDVGRDYTFNPTLEIGLINETVVVTAGADILNATSAELANTVSPKQIKELPINGRDPLALIQLQAGVASNGQTNTSINGQRPSFTNITRDGINVQDQYIRENASDFSPQRQTVDSISEFTVTTSNAGAELGYGASHVQQVTPRGQSEFHGNAYAYNRNSFFAANNFFNNAAGRDANGNERIPRNRLNRNQFGGSISGPFPAPRFGEGGPSLIRGRSFFFANYEGFRQPVGSTRSRTILTPSARQGIFTYTRADNGQLQQVNLLDPVFNTGITSIDPTILARVINRLPTEGNAAGGDARNTTGFRFNQANDQTREQFTTRIDHDINGRHSIGGIFAITRGNTLRPDLDGGGFDPTPIVSNRSDNELLVLTYRMTPGGSFTNEIRGGFFKSRVPFVRSEEAPSFFIGGLPTSNPDATFLEQGRESNNYNFQDNAQYTRGNHSFRFGGVSQFVRVNSYAAFSTVPTYSLGTNAFTQITQAQFLNPALFPGGVPTAQRGTANSLLALYGGLISSASQSFNATAEGFVPGAPTLNVLAFENIGLYFSDQWRVRPNLTLTLGVRYDLFTPVRDVNNSQLEPTIPRGADPVEALLNPVGTLNFVGTNTGTDASYFTDWNNFAPNVSVAWSPNFRNKFLGGIFPGDGRTVIRGGYNMAYVNDEYLRGALSGNEANPGLGSTTTLTNLRDRISALPTIPIPALVVPRTFAQSQTLSSNNFSFIGGIDPNIKVPFTHQYNVGIQRELGWQTALEIRYVGGSSNNLTNQLDYNQIDIFRGGFFNDFQTARNNLLLSRQAVAAGRNVRISGAFNPAITGSQQFTGAFLQLGNAAPFGSQPIAGNPFAQLGGLDLGGIIADLDNQAPGQLAFRLISNRLNGTAGLRPNENGGTISLLENISRYNYNSLQVELRRRFAQGFGFQANYTFSKTLSDYSGLDQLRFQPRLDNNRPELEYTRADYDQTHRFNFNSIYELPFGRGKRFFGDANGFVDRLLGGFQLGSIVEVGSGNPITLTYGQGTLNRSTRSARQTPNTNLSGDQLRGLFGVFERDGVLYYINPDVLQITRTASGTISRATLGYDTLTGQELTFPGQAFFLVPAGQTGNTPRAFGDGPWFFNINASLIKNITVKENFRVQLRAEAFNVLNRANFATPALTEDVTDSTFGQITSTFSPRVLQFAIRLEF